MVYGGGTHVWMLFRASIDTYTSRAELEVGQKVFVLNIYIVLNIAAWTNITQMG